MPSEDSGWRRSRWRRAGCRGGPSTRDPGRPRSRRSPARAPSGWAAAWATADPLRISAPSPHPSPAPTPIARGSRAPSACRRTPVRSADCASPPRSLRHELLDALPLERFAGVEVPLRIDGDAADRIERAGIAAAVAEAADGLERVAAQDEDLLIVAVGDVEIALLRIARQRDVPHRAGTFRPRRNDALLQELAIRVVGLHAVVAAVADVDRAVPGDARAAHGLWLGLARSRPVPLVSAGRGIEHDDAVVDEAVGDEDLGGGRIEIDGGRAIEPGRAVVVAGCAGLADLQQEVAARRELEHLRVLRLRRRV